jgi:hypothetical protein
MITELITELSYDKITLAQALTRAKLIQSKLKSELFKSWLANELNGYSELSEVPAYRIINIKIVGDFADDFGRQWKNTPLLLQDLGKSMGIDLYEYHEMGSIKSIEDAVNQSKPGSSLMIFLNQTLVEDLSTMYQRNHPHTRLLRAGRIVYPSQYTIILDQTKQKLLDILLELENEFPNLINDYRMSEENKKIVKNIITNNIYGSNNPMNIAAGETVAQSGNTITLTTNAEAKLSSLGVEANQIDELKKIIKESPRDSDGLKKKIMKWLGTVSASVGARGLYDNIPAITEFVQNLIYV